MQRAQLAAEPERSIPELVVEWLDAEAVAGNEEPPPPRVPDGEREHAPEAGDDVIAPLLVAVDDGFGVRVGAEGMARSRQLSTQFMVIIDLPIEHDLHAVVFVADRPLAARHVDDAEPAHTEPDTGRHKMALVVRAPVPDGAAHPGEERIGLGAIERQSCETGDTAHDQAPGRSTMRRASAASRSHTVASAQMRAMCTYRKV